jgi:cytoskeleton protein RodZ
VAGDVSFHTMSETIGQQLKQARIAKNLTLLKVVQATHIRANQIEAIEADDFEALPSAVQARAYLRMYAEFLGLSVDEIITRQRGNIDEIQSAPEDRTQATVEISKSDDDIISEKIPAVETQKVEDRWKLPAVIMGGLLTGVKRLLSHPESPSTPMEPVENSNLLEPMETENQEGVPSPEGIPAPAPAILPSQVIFNTIGKTLRERRESLSLTLDEIERHIHVRIHYLEALETGAFNQLPSSVQARGMMNNYAHFLDLDVDALLLTYAEGLQTQRLERQPLLEAASRKPTSKEKVKTSQPFRIPPSIRRYLSVDVFFGSGLVILLLAFAIWGTNRIINLRAGSTPQPTAPSISNVLVSTPEAGTISPTSTTSGNEGGTIVPGAGETLVMTLPAAGNGAVQVVVVANEQAWVRVTVDGKVMFEGRVNAGSAYPYDGNTQIEVLTGNGRAITILYNQNNLGPMGNTGEVVDHIYTMNAILNPTATFTLTPTITQTPTVTRRPTLTLRPSLTPRPSSTPVR